jgi:mono/diheme cytochrome c family protein
MSGAMRIAAVAVAFAFAVLLLGAGAVQANPDMQSFSMIRRGKYLTTLGDCVACHTAPGGKPFAGGRAIATPFGALIAPNITPDGETGIGDWTDAQFTMAMQKGIGRGGEHLYPAMPYPYYTKAATEDILAIRAYLNTLESVRNAVKSNQLPFPFDIRASMLAWNMLFFTPGEFKPVAGKSEEWNRGAYLVDGLGHCGACHTAKNFLGGDKASKAYQGGILQGWYAPNITDDKRTGLGGWSVEDIAEYLKTGHNRIAAASGPMAEVVSDSMQWMTDADLKAIAVYLKDLPGQNQEVTAVSAQDRAVVAGQTIYVDNCSACHTPTGAGIPQLFPALANAPSIQSADATSLIRVVLQGTQSVATVAAPTAPAMPALGWKLSDEEVASVVTYIRNSWGNAAVSVSASDVHSARQVLSGHSD